jgi:hypothetical protein
MGLRCWKDTQTGISFSIFFFICKKKKKWTGTPGMDGPTSFRERFEDEKKNKEENAEKCTGGILRGKDKKARQKKDGKGKWKAA